ncbi:atrial natriuretic peptide receptor 3-like [Octopus sinensis]|uniref:Atrial natriuretic peptide receptor 3-like n=1 Tax=Octopus sinensis TaxID=2607531 RepID=A0A7E6F2L5_9MOLL|nr:atrial natriuretic peptide receptor 3-like [Octopus sinensis]
MEKEKHTWIFIYLTLQTYLYFTEPFQTEPRRHRFGKRDNSATHNDTVDLNVTEVRIAVLVSTNNSLMFSIDRISPAIDLAIEKVMHSGNLRSIRIKVNYHGVTCDATQPPLAAFKFYMNNEVDIFFGPVCEYALAPVSRYSFYWNIPVISPGGMAHDFQDKTEFGSLTRVGITFNGLSDSLLSIFRYYNWRKVYVLYNSNGLDTITFRFCFFTVSALAFQLTKENISYHFHILENGGLNIKDVLLKGISTDIAGKLFTFGAWHSCIFRDELFLLLSFFSVL